MPDNLFSIEEVKSTMVQGAFKIFMIFYVNFFENF